MEDDENNSKDLGIVMSQRVRQQFMHIDPEEDKGEKEQSEF